MYSWHALKKHQTKKPKTKKLFYYLGPDCINRSSKSRTRWPVKLVLFVLARTMLQIPWEIHFLIKHKCYFQMSLKSHQGSTITHMLVDTKPRNIRGNSRKIYSIFLLTALYAKPTAHFWLHLYKCQAPFSHPYPKRDKSDFNGVFKLLQKQKPNIPNTFPSRAEIWCYCINHLISLAKNRKVPSTA